MRVRLATSGAALAILAIGLTGCTFVTPQATTKQYDASDGVSARIGEVKVINVIAVTGDDGVGLNLVFTGHNYSDSDIELATQFEVDGDKTEATVDLKPGSTNIGSTKQFLLEDAESAAGSLFPVYFQYGDEPGTQLLVPVFDSSWSEYADLVPTAPPKPTTKPAPTPTPTETPAP